MVTYIYNRFMIFENKLVTQFGLVYIAFDTLFNNISIVSWRSVLLMEETGVPGENHRPSASH